MSFGGKTPFLTNIWGCTFLGYMGCAIYNRPLIFVKSMLITEPNIRHSELNPLSTCSGVADYSV